MKRKIWFIFVFAFCLIFQMGKVNSIKYCDYYQTTGEIDIRILIYSKNDIRFFDDRNGNVFYGTLSKEECPKTVYADSSSIFLNFSTTKTSKFSIEFSLYDEGDYQLKKVSCGNITNIPAKFTELSSFAIRLIQIAVPIILIILGSIDLFKGITAQKEDEIKKGQQTLIKRLITAALIFFVVVIVKFFVSLIANSTSTANIVDCIDCFINNDCNV